MDHRIFSFTGIYKEQDFWREPADEDAGSRFYDFTQLSGTRGYLSEEAAAVLTEQITRFPADQPLLTFIDSGNTHYMAKLLTDRLTQDFTLVLLDHHPDMQLPAFGGLLSCGSWVRAALLENPHLREVWLLGVDERLAREALADDPGEWEPSGTPDGILHRTFSGKELHLISELPADADALRSLLARTVLAAPRPLYLSIDKDVLSPDDVHTDWDQGDLSLEVLCRIAEYLTAHARLLGADVCGECDVSASTPAQYLQENALCNRKLLDIFQNPL